MSQNEDEQLIRIYRYGVDFDFMLSKRKPVHVYLIGNYAGKTKEFHPWVINNELLKEFAEQVKKQ